MKPKAFCDYRLLCSDPVTGEPGDQVTPDSLLILRELAEEIGSENLHVVCAQSPRCPLEVERSLADAGVFDIGLKPENVIVSRRLDFEALAILFRSHDEKAIIFHDSFAFLRVMSPDSIKVLVNPSPGEIDRLDRFQFSSESRDRQSAQHCVLLPHWDGENYHVLHEHIFASADLCAA